MSQLPRLLHQVRATLRRLHYSLRTEEAYVAWIIRFGLLGTGVSFTTLTTSFTVASKTTWRMATIRVTLGHFSRGTAS